MRIVNGLLCVLLVLFVAVQYNDPDGPVWMLIYAIPAAFAGFAAFRPGRLLGRLPTLALGLCLVVSAAGTIYMWPTDVGFWRPEVFWDNELDREAMGLMIVTLALAIVALTRWRLGSRQQGAA